MKPKTLTIWIIALSIIAVVSINILAGQITDLKRELAVQNDNLEWCFRKIMTFKADSKQTSSLFQTCNWDETYEFDTINYRYHLSNDGIFGGYKDSQILDFIMSQEAYQLIKIHEILSRIELLIANQ